MKHQKKYVKEIVRGILLTALSCTLCACPSPDSTPPSLSVSPNYLVFEGTANSTRIVNIKTEAEWSVNVQGIDWLKIDYVSGSGNSTVNFTTTKDNEDNERRKSVIFRATNDDGTTTDTLTVVQPCIYPDNCTVEVSSEPTAVLRLTYGVSCRINYGSNTKYFHYHFYKEQDYYNNLQGDRTKIEQAARSWTRITPAVGEECVVRYDECEPGTNYMLVMIPYTSSGNRGRLCEYPIYTKKLQDQALAEIKNVQFVDGVYQWEVDMKERCTEYYTYACAGSSEFKTWTDSNNKREDTNRRGILLSWELNKEMAFDSETHNNTSINSGSGTHDTFYALRYQSGKNTLQSTAGDKYLEIFTWGLTSDEKSGIVHDVIYRIENGTLTPIASIDLKALKGGNPDWILSVSPETINFPSTGDNKRLSITSNDDWTASVSANSFWCTLSDYSGSNNGSISVKVEKNSTKERRSATIKVTGKKSEIVRTVEVNQDPESPTIIGRDDYEDDIDLSKN